MRRRELILGLAGALGWHAARAQQMPIVGFLSSQSPDLFGRYVAAFRRGLGEAGYVEGKTIAIEYRWAAGREETLPALAADLVRHRVAVIAATGGLESARAAKAATTEIPVVFNLGSDPIAAGLVTSFSRPGGNVTGITWFNAELAGKRVALLHELVPSATVIGYLANPHDPENPAQTKDAADSAQADGCRLVVLQASTPAEIDAAFAALAEQHVGALVIGAGAFFVGGSVQIVELAARYAVPTAYPVRNAVENGGLMSYGNDLADAYRRNGRYVARILKGDRAGDLPIDRSSKFELLINMRTAKSLGLTVPQLLLAQADEVIE